jgi:hypothetical protein
MSTFGSIVTDLLYTAAFVVCLWWANWAFRQLNLRQSFNLPVAVRLLVVLAAGNLVYYPIARIMGAIFDTFRRHGNGWINLAAAAGALAMLGCVAWLYSRATREQ